MTDKVTQLRTGTQRVTRTYRDHVIELTDDMDFKVEGPMIESSIRVSSFEIAKDRIDKLFVAERKSKSVKLSLAVMDGYGRQGMIHGLHAGNGKALGVDADYVYPNVSWIKDALAKLRKLEEQVSTLRARVRRFEIKTSRSYHRISGEQYESLVITLQQEHERKTKTAQDEAAHWEKESA